MKSPFKLLGSYTIKNHLFFSGKNTYFRYPIPPLQGLQGLYLHSALDAVQYLKYYAVKARIKDEMTVK